MNSSMEDNIEYIIIVLSDGYLNSGEPYRSEYYVWYPTRGKTILRGTKMRLDFLLNTLLKECQK